MNSNHIVRWYVLTLPLCHRGPAKGLQAELERRLRNGEPSFEYFAPSYVEVKESGGVWTKSNRPLLFNYVFIHASENEIFRIKRQLPLYNFLPYVREGKQGYYPYISDSDMENLKWVAESYSNVLPVYVPEPEKLMKGDRVRIIEGEFKGIEARVVTQAGAGRKEIMVCVENWMWVPLLRVQAGQYEVVELNQDSKHIYTHLDNDSLSDKLHDALRRHHSPEGVTEKDRALAADVLKRYACLRMDTDIMRCKLYSFLLPAYTILDNRKEYEQLIGLMQSMVPLVKAEQASAQLLLTLYACTDNSIYHHRAHALIDPWRCEQALKKAKRRLIRQLDDCDMWLGHGKPAPTPQQTSTVRPHE